LGMTHNLNGSISLTGRDGAVSRLNAEQVLQRLRKQPLYGAREFRNGRTAFEKLAVNLKIAQGNANVEEGRLENPRLRISLTGAASIPTRDLDLRGTATLFENGRNDTAPSLELPFAVRGSWEEPIPLFDTRVLIERSQSGGRLLPKAPEPTPAG